MTWPRPLCRERCGCPAQVAPSILKLLGLDPNALQGVVAEKTPLLPKL